MTTPRWRVSFISLFGGFFDPAKHEQLQESKAEIDSKVESMLRDLEEEDNNERHAALANMIEEFHSHYITLYEQYNHLAEVLRKEEEGKRVKKGSSSSSDSSDSDDTLKKKGAKNVELEVDHMKHELETAVAEIAELQFKLAASTDEKGALQNEYLTISKLEEAQKAATELSSAAETLNEEKGGLSLRISQLDAELNLLGEQLAEKDRELLNEHETFNSFKEVVNEKQESAEKYIHDLNQKKHAAEEENKNLDLKISELEDEIRKLGDKIEDHANQVSHLNEKLDEKERALSLEQEKFAAYKKENKKVLESAEKEIYKLKQVERTLACQLEIHEAHKEETSTRQRGLELELCSSLAERREFEEKKTEELAELRQKLSDMETQVRARDHEASQSLIQVETLRKELAKREKELGGTVEEKESLFSQLEELKTELDSTRNQNSVLDEELKGKTIEISGLLLQIKTLKETGEKRTAEQQKKEENLVVKLKGLNVEVETLTYQIHEFEEQIRSKEEEISHLKEENEKFKDEVSLNEKLLIEKENEFSKARIEFEDGGSRHSALILELTTQISSLDEELRLSLEKLEEITRSLQSETDAKTELEAHAEELKKHLDSKSDAITSLVESLRDAQEKEMQTSRRLHVAERMLNEKDESLMRKETKLKEEQNLAAVKVSTLTERITACSEAHRKTTSELSHKVTAALSEMDAFHMKVEEGCGHVDSRIHELNQELKAMENWINEINTKKDQMKAQEMTLKGKITELENELQKGVREKTSLVKSVQERDEKIRELENRMAEKEVGYESLSEEKREAIRQLCIWIEYHRDRYDHLRKVVVRGGKRRRQIATA